jgi:UV DNA damage repair endonuclease
VNTETLKSQIEHEIDLHRIAISTNLVVLSDISDKPLPEGHPNVESAIMARMGEIGKIVNEQHSRVHSLRALKSVRRKIERLEKKKEQP